MAVVFRRQGKDHFELIASVAAKDFTRHQPVGSLG